MEAILIQGNEISQLKGKQNEKFSEYDDIILELKRLVEEIKTK